MSGAFKKLANEINLKIDKVFEEVELEKKELQDEEGILCLSFASPKIIPVKQIKKLFEAIKKNINLKIRYQFKVISINSTMEMVLEYLEFILTEIVKKNVYWNIIKRANKTLRNNTLELRCQSDMEKRFLINAKNKIEASMQRFGFEKFILKIFESRKIDEKILEEEKNNNSKLTKKLNKEISSGKVFTEKAYKEIQEIMQNPRATERKIITTSGKIFNIKEGSKNILIVSISNFIEAINIIFSKRTFEQYKKILKIGETIKVTGKIRVNKYINEPEIMINSLEKTVDPFLRIDEEIDKRIEFNAKTQMSSMDGITNPIELIQLIKKWKHKAIAIADVDSVQSFPDFYFECKKNDIKAIYGCAFNTISKKNAAVSNHIIEERNLENDTYAIIDLETTGLSPIHDDIIEFGGIILRKNEIIEKKQFFIKTNKKVSKFIKDLTKITDEDLKNGYEELEGIKQIRDFVKDYTIVAHNARFDFDFINEKLDKHNLPLLKNPVIDTVVVAKIAHDFAKKFRLENVAARFYVSYSGNEAHRADYDAEVLARVWKKMIFSLKVKKIITQKDLSDFANASLYTKTFPHSVVLIAKNQKGLKELFKFSSISHTTNFFKGPRLFLEDVVNRKNLLLGSGGLGSRLVEKMFYSSKNEIEKEIQKYDYIEIQPPHNFKHLVEPDEGMEKVHKILKITIDLARKNKKIVVATSDSRYLYPKEKIFHEIYINTKGLGGVRHYLFNFDKNKNVYPDQYLMTTKEMKRAFAFLGDKKLIDNIVIYNTHKLAKKIDEIEVIKKSLHTPEFKNADILLKELAYKNARKQYGDKLPKIIEDRLEKELVPIIKYGFANIYWISHLLVKKSLEDKYLVGSRGSVGSSLVATMTKITEVNPLVPHYVCKKCKYSEFFENSPLNSGYDLPAKKCPKCGNDLWKDGQKIPFETFLGFAADKIPDIDLNFSGEYQHKIHKYVKDLFGEDKCFRAGTISTVAERTAFGFVKAWIEEYSSKSNYSKAFIEFLAKGLAGTKRTTGQHPGGIIVIPQNYDVEDFTPINYPANDITSDWRTTHFDFRAIHDNVLKLDLLGHDDPTVIKMLERLTGKSADKIPTFDQKVISLFSSPKELGIKPNDINGEEVGVLGLPEFGTKFVRGMLRSTKVKTFGDLISVSGLSHGTDVWNNNAEKLIKNRKLTLNDTISCRDDIMTDLIAKGIKPLNAFNIMENVRKGKGISKEEERLLRTHNVQDWYINSLKKIKYMFPKAHATAYVMMAWRIAWFKLYYPLEFYATYFATRANAININVLLKGKEKIEETLKDFEARKRYAPGEKLLSNKEILFIPVLEVANEMYARGFEFVNLDIKKSQAFEWVIDQGKYLIPPFSVIDGFGEAVAKSIIKARNKKPFSSIDDLYRRTLINKTNLKKLEELKILESLPKTNQVEMKLEI